MLDGCDFTDDGFWSYENILILARFPPITTLQYFIDNWEADI